MGPCRQEMVEQEITRSRVREKARASEKQVGKRHREGDRDERDRAYLFATHECTAALPWKCSCVDYELISCPPP